MFAPLAASAALCGILPCPDGSILAQLVADAEVSSYGILECSDNQIKKILEKPSPEATPSRLAIAARFHLSDRILRLLKEYVHTPLTSGEYDLTTGLNRALLHTMQLVAVITEAHRFDCGSPEGYRKAQEHFGE